MGSSRRLLKKRAPVQGVESSGGKGKNRRERWQNPDPPEFEVSQPSTDQAPEGGVAIDAPRQGIPPGSSLQLALSPGLPRSLCVGCS